MAVNVSYLLGAGASYQTIPLIKKTKQFESLGEEIRLFAEKLESRATADSFKQIASEKKVVFDVPLKLLVKGLTELASNTIQFSSPDTYAKSLYLIGDQDQALNQHKLFLSFFLSVFQNKNPKIDERYVPFLASILQDRKGVSFTENVKILSWNYDFQLELALKKYKPGLHDLSKIQTHFGIIPTLVDNVDPSVIHLNGVAGTLTDDRQKIFVDAFSNEFGVGEDEYFLSMINNYATWFNNHRNLGPRDFLSFAWELKSGSRIDLAKKIMRKTQVLVAIGYSFPFFNRSIDQVLLNEFVGNDFLNKEKKIYIQNPNATEEYLSFFRETHKIVPEISIVSISETEQFFLPPEL